MLFARNAQTSPRVFEISGFLAARVACKIVITLSVNFISKDAFSSVLAYSATKNMFILCCLASVLFLAITLMPALGPQSYSVNLARISVFAFVVGVVLANLVNIALQASEAYLPVAVVACYVTLPLLVPAVAVWRFKGRALACRVKCKAMSY